MSGTAASEASEASEEFEAEAVGAGVPDRAVSAEASSVTAQTTGPARRPYR
ncbi:hypothetical protein OG909_24180 [Streptomyces sp. NBC_01754]|uniref:hypothetical protein n=1 Tax=Streptomyces sp. NBC_01754 TaxID=2975930 RepID=UPI002DDB0DC0|nr:hypothetical protein [Streptomyces sp. NBC_01754]WSC95120.1 hypothetical protein OG909_24180 [Streptomyces sp. NBC_01754]